METKCRAAVFHKVGDPISIDQFEIPPNLEPGAALCRVRMSTICGSDLHTISGRREEPTPIILGHEVIGDVVALGHEPGPDRRRRRDGFGDELKVGDRVSWPVIASCGSCFFCERRLPQKCDRLRKYGHAASTQWPHLTGGYAEYIYLHPGTVVFRVPANVSDRAATPANCALSTMVHATEAVGLSRGETVLIQGAGMLGLNLVALAKEAGAGKIIITDAKQDRLEWARNFGADRCLNVRDVSEKEMSSVVLEETDGRGVDVAFEVCGLAAAARQAASALRIGGRYLIAGMVTPGCDLGIDGNLLTRKCLTITGIHNYRPEHLGTAIRFLETNSTRYPFESMVGRTFPMEDINEAIDAAVSGDHIRVAVINSQIK